MGTVTVHGQQFDLEDRVCRGGCGLTFSVQRGSPIVTARRECNYICFGGAYVAKHRQHKGQKVVDLASLASVVVESPPQKQKLEVVKSVSRLTDVEQKLGEMQLAYIEDCLAKAQAAWKKTASPDLIDKMVVASWTLASRHFMLGGDLSEEVKKYNQDIFAERVGVPSADLERWCRIRAMVSRWLPEAEHDDEFVLEGVCNKIREGMTGKDLLALVKQERASKAAAKDCLEDLKKVRDSICRLDVDLKTMDSKDMAKYKEILDELNRKFLDVGKK